MDRIASYRLATLLASLIITLMIAATYVSAEPETIPSKTSSKFDNQIIDAESESSLLGAIPLTLGKSISIDAHSNPVNSGDSKLAIIGIGTGKFELDKDMHLTAVFSLQATQFAKVDYWIYAAVFDKNAELLATDSHKEQVDYIRFGGTPTMFREIEMDFGISQKFESAKFVVVSISERNVSEP